MSYGYKFLRINKFNIGTNPIETLDNRINSLLAQSSAHSRFLAGIHETIEGIQNGDIRQCPKCKEIRILDDFRDDTLISGWGKICNQCKETKKSERKTPSGIRVRTTRTSVSYSSSKTNCPKCGSRMVPRTGRYGTFWGCSRFPYCKGTRNF